MELWSELQEWVAIPSVTGSEGDYADALARRLRTLGLEVELQPVAPGRSNVLARRGSPRVIFCTHLDTVPPFFGPREDAEFVHGRGSRGGVDGRSLHQARFDLFIETVRQEAGAGAK